MLQERPFGEPIIHDDARLIPHSEGMLSMTEAQIRQHYGGMPVPAGGPRDGQTHVLFSDAPPPDALSASSDVESRTTKGDEEASGFYRSDTEPSEVQDQPIMKAEEPPDGNQSDEEDPQDGNQSTNSGHSRESASCEKVVRILAEVTHSCFTRNTAIPAHIQADVPLPAPHSSELARNHSRRRSCGKWRPTC